MTSNRGPFRETRAAAVKTPTRHIAAIALLLAASNLARAQSAPSLAAPYITGSHYSARALLPVYVDEVGEPVTPDRLEAIARRVEDLYRRDGFIAPLVVTQRADSATPHLHVFEARLAAVRVRGDAGPYAGLVEATAARLQQQGVLHQAQTRAAIARMSDLPGLAVRSSIDAEPGNPNAFAMTLDVRYQRVTGAVGATSRIADEIGEGLLSARIILNSLLGTGEQLAFTAASASTFGVYTYVSARASRGFGRVHIDLFASHADAGTEPDSHYESQRASIEASAVALRRDALTLRPVLGFALRNASDRDDGGDAWSITRTRAVLAGVELTAQHATRSSRLRVAAERGLSAWDARTFVRTGTAAEAEFSKATLELSHVQVLAPRWQLRGAFEAQWSGDDLPSGERFTYGGAQIGRAFDPGAMIADRGASASLQVERSHRWNNAWLDSGRAWLVGDYGIGEDTAASIGTQRGASLGAGAALRTGGLSTTVELGYAVKRIAEADRRLRAFVTTQYAF